jgi:energy-coupling factor transporter ATP-binding protein EcfA2
MNIKEAAADHLNFWFSSKPVIALMGEYSAGKSTLLNLLLDRDVLPTKVTATNLPAVWLTFSESETLQGLRHDGTLEPVTFESLGETVRDDYLLIRMGVNAEILRKTDIIDTPGISDPKLAKGATLYLGPYLDAVLWLSPANQAWRQTEKSVWTSFPERLRPESLCVLTRADKLRRASDLTKVRNRVTRDTKGLFGVVLPIDTPKAARFKATPQDDEWEQSGGAAFFEALETVLTTAEKEQTARAGTAPAPAEQTVAPAAPKKKTKAKTARTKPAPKKKPARTSKKAVSKKPMTVSNSEPQDTLGQILAALDDVAQKEPQYDQIASLFDQLNDKIEGDKSINPTQRLVWKSCLNAGADTGANVERLLEQTRYEILDFKSDSWCVVHAA